MRGNPSAAGVMGVFLKRGYWFPPRTSYVPRTVRRKSLVWSYLRPGGKRKNPPKKPKKAGSHVSALAVTRRGSLPNVGWFWWSTRLRTVCGVYGVRRSFIVVHDNGFCVDKKICGPDWMGRGDKSEPTVATR